MKKVITILFILTSIFINVVVSANELTGNTYIPEDETLLNLYRDFYLFDYNGTDYIFDKSGNIEPKLYNKRVDDFFFGQENATSYKLVNNTYMVIYNQATYNKVFIMGDSWKQYSKFYVKFYDLNFNLLGESNLKSYISDYGYQDNKYYCILSTGLGTKYVITEDMITWEETDLFEVVSPIKKIDNLYFTKNEISFNNKESFYNIIYEDKYIGRTIGANTDIPLVFSFVPDIDTDIINLYISKDKINYIKVSLNNLFENGELQKYNGFSPITCWYFNNNNLVIKAINEKYESIDVDILKAELDKIHNSPYVKYNNQILAFEQPPVIQDDYTLIPIRFLFEQMGADVTWNQDTQTATITQNDTAITFGIDDTEASVNGNTVSMDIPARLINDKTMVPVRFLSEELGYTVDWDGENRIITIE